MKKMHKEVSNQEILLALNSFKKEVRKEFKGVNESIQFIIETSATKKQLCTGLKNTKDELITHIDGIAHNQNTLKLEVAALKSQQNRFEQKLK